MKAEGETSPFFVNGKLGEGHCIKDICESLLALGLSSVTSCQRTFMVYKALEEISVCSDLIQWLFLFLTPTT